MPATLQVFAFLPGFSQIDVQTGVFAVAKVRQQFRHPADALIGRPIGELVGAWRAVGRAAREMSFRLDVSCARRPPSPVSAIRTTSIRRSPLR